MAIPTVQNSAIGRTETTTTTDATLTVSSNSGRVLLAFPETLELGQTHTVSSVVFDPGGGDEASFTNIPSASANNTAGGRYQRSEAWYLVLGDGVSSGSYTVRLTVSASINRVALAVLEIAGADTTSPIGASGAGTGSSTTITVDVTTTVANSLVIGGGSHRDTTNFTPGTSDTEVIDDAYSLNSVWVGHTDAASTTTYTVSADVDSAVTNTWSMSGVEVLEAATAQTAYAIADAYVGNWEDEGGATTNLYQSIDEASASDADYIQSEIGPSSSPCVVQLTSLSDPSVSTGHTLNYRYAKSPGATAQIDLTVELRQGYTNEGSPGTLIATHTYTNISTTVTAASETLTAGEADSITDYTDLYLRFVANAP